MVISINLCCLNSIIAQKNYLDAKIITKQGDSIFGFIDYQQWDRSPSVIKFLKGNSEDPMKYGPEKIHSFQVANDLYESRRVSVSESPRKTANITYETEYKPINKTVFLLVLVSGDASLYQYVDEMGTDHYYIETKKQPLLELIFFKYLVEENGIRGIKENTKFKGQIIAYLNNCRELHGQIGKANYNSSSLSKIVVEYNKCVNADKFYVHKIEKNKYRFGIFIGATITNIIFGTTSYRANFNNSIYPTLGAAMLLEPARGRGKWTLYSDLHFMGHYYRTQHTDYIDENKYDYYDVKYNCTYLKFTIMGRYNIIGHKIIPYLGAGMHFAKTLINNSHFYEEKKRYSEPLIYSYPLDSRDFDYGFSIGIGAMYKKFNLDVRFDIGGIGPYSGTSSAKTYYLVFGYIFN